MSAIRFLFMVGLALVLSAPPASAAVGDQGYGPTSNEAVDADLRALGYRNGNMPSTRLLEVDGCLLERDAAYTLSLMLEAARTDGVALYAQECYRSLGSQVSAYDRRCPEVEEEIKKVDPETGEEEVVKVKKSRSCSGPPIARPGRSNHGWGRAVDFGQGRRVLACGDAGFAWLQDNASRFGWVHPGWAHCGRSTQEPWHWEWGGLTNELPLLVVEEELGQPSKFIR